MRRLAVVSLPIAALFGYVQQPDRALWNFHYLVTPFAALVLERVPVPQRRLAVQSKGEQVEVERGDGDVALLDRTEIRIRLASPGDRSAADPEDVTIPGITHGLERTAGSLPLVIPSTRY